MSHVLKLASAFALLVALPSCAPSTAVAEAEHSRARPITVAPPATDATAPVDYPGVHNLVAYGHGIYSGSVPDAGAGFETLANMGVRTIISVDGATPAVEEATSRGMRYVHLPITYGGIDETTEVEIARAIRDLPGPVYVHCHHGKHRSAAAAAVASVDLGLLDNQQALERMKVSGTAPNYKGLFACATKAKPLTAMQLDAASNAFPSVRKTTGLVSTMVEVDEINDHLKAIEKAGWKTPTDHPDLVPTAEAGRLADLLRNARENSESMALPSEFRDWLLASSEKAEALEKSLGSGTASPTDMAAQMKALGQSCKDCHTKYRD